MAENVMDQIVADLRASAATHFPKHGELKNIRIVGHTPKTDHFIYDVVIDFETGSERLAAKVYRASKTGQQAARNLARQEHDNLAHVYSLFAKKGMDGVPRPIGDFSELCAIVTEKFVGVPLQSIIMKGALLPGFADNGALGVAATMTGHWLRNFQKCTADMPEPFDSTGLMTELEELCQSCKGEGLDDAAIRTILSGARKTLASAKQTLPSSAVLNDFSPLNVVVSEKGISFNEFAHMRQRGSALHDAAQFLACIEALEKYPFCNRSITSQVQENFIEAYGVTGADAAILRVLKMRALLSMFAQGRNTGKESAMRKKVMWATVMKRFIQQAAQRTLVPAA